MDATGRGSAGKARDPAVKPGDLGEPSETVGASAGGAQRVSKSQSSGLAPKVALGMSGVITPLPPLTLVLGGARSGKSRYAEGLIDRHPGRRTYLATAEILDDEMSARVKAHRDRRDSDWKTVEEPLALAQALKAETEQGAAVLVDCLTLWLGNLLGREQDAEAEIADLVASVGQFGGPVVFVSNEVGLGIVPDNPMARRFRDLAGMLHQRLAEKADHVAFVAAGLPMKLK
jgi:adenosylcobinamide kinase/adenosylcobinamide-phosphate guanylyltransferase